MNTIVTAYHQHARIVRLAGTWLGAGLLVLAMVLASLPELGVTQVQLELLTWGGGALGGAVLLPEAQRALQRWLSTGGGVLLIVAAQYVTAHWPGQAGATFLAAVLTGFAGLAKAGAWIPAPNTARLSVPPEASP